MKHLINDPLKNFLENNIHIRRTQFQLSDIFC